MAGNILSICSFIVANQAAEPASKCIRLNHWWMAVRRFKFSKLLLPSNDIHESCTQRQITQYTSRCPRITQKFTVVDNTFLSCHEKVLFAYPRPKHHRSFQTAFQCST